ncbi:hypothetical protein D7V91_11450 [bacterium 1xD42-67]|nr:hypothetical protein D7V91_11450 [bacterium 1xD42-67]
MYKSSDVADRLRSMAKLRGVSMASVLSDCGLNFNAMTHMKKSMPNAGSLAKLADRLECSVDYLLGRTTEMLTPGAGQAPAPIQDDGCDLEDAPQLSKDAAEMLELFEQLPGREQVLFLGRLQEAVARTVGEGGARGSGSSPVKAG